MVTLKERPISRVLLIDGGWSDEAVHNYGWASAVLPLLCNLVAEVIVLRLEEKDFLQQILGLRAKIDVVFPATLGTYGEDGRLQGLLDLLGVPYVGTGSLGSAICMHKYTTKSFLRRMGFPVAEEFFVAQHQPFPDFQTLRDRWNTPLVVKPAASGASLNLSVVHDAQAFVQACSLAALAGDFLIEPFIAGEEYAVGVIDEEDGPLVLPICHILLDNQEGYDTTSKLSPHYGFPTERECPQAPQMRTIARAIHTTLCSGFSRLDLKVDPQGMINILEINTLPGLLPFSVLPVSAQQVGISKEMLLLKLLQSAFRPKPLSNDHRPIKGKSYAGV